MTIEKLERPSRIDEERIQKLKELFPEAFADGKVNFAVLREEIAGLDEELLEENEEEAFGLRWVGKNEARKLAFKPPQGTLKIVEGEGINEKKTKNIFIEGDNLEVLRLLQKSYAGKIKLIYIDPPYNTGNDFVYKDDFQEPVEKYLMKTNQADEQGLLVSNPKSSGRFHANWLNMMYPRLKLARNLLRDDGVIFVSIDDNEQANLKKIMDEVFGEENFVANIVWQKKYSPQNDATYFSDMHDFLVVYAKQKKQSKNDPRGWQRVLLPRTEEQNSLYRNPDNDPRGPWKAVDFSVKTYSPDYDYTIITPSGREVRPPNGRCWMTSKERFEELVRDKRIWFGKNGNNVPSLKKFLSEVQDGTVPTTWWQREECGDNQEATQELRSLFADTGVPFETPKPVRLIKRILQISTQPHENDIVLDFFAGSGTTAQAVLELNKEDGGNRSFILVQLPERTNNGQYPTIAEVTKERIRRVIKKLNEQDNNKQQLDRGFSVYKLDKSNLKKWESYYNEAEIEHLENELDLFTNAYFTEGWTENDVVIELMLNQGFPLDSHIELRSIENNLWIVKHDNVPYSMIICLDNQIGESAIKYLIDHFKDDLFICIDNALSDQAKIVLSESMKVKTI